MHFAVVYSPGPAWLAGKTVFEQPLQEHFAFMQDLFDQGFVIMGGPFTDTAGAARALAILEVDNETVVASLVARDPIVVKRIAVAEVHPWQLLLQRGTHPCS